jgi:hypothetical protein
VDKDLRASLAAACGAAALSALVGVIAGVGFFVLVLRALVCGLLLGAAVYCGILFLKRALPGIADASPAAAARTETESAAAPELGANVDIVLPGEAEEVDDPGAGAESLVARLIPEGPAEAEYVEEGSLLEPELQGAEAEPAIPPNANPDHERRPPTVGFDELDVLPDLDGFADSFTASEFARGGSQETAERSSGSRGNGSGGGSSGARSGQEGADPAALAQAVRTILKRDQKG